VSRYTVYLDRCPQYDSENIYEVLQSALSVIPLLRKISGKIVIKPNLVLAHPRIATDGFTRAEVIESVLKLIESQAPDNTSIEIVEKAGLGVTTASMFRWAGYKKLTRKYPVRLCSMEESKQSILVLKNSKTHKHITVSRSMADRDFLIFIPKLKTNVLSQGYTGAMKLNMGSIDSRERIQFHDYRLPQKIVDLLEYLNPDLIVTDGVRFSYGGNQMTQKGMNFGLIAVCTNAVAHDMVCAKLLGHEPMQITHIREAVERGYGPNSIFKRFPQLDVVIGKIEKKLNVSKVLLIGDCAQASVGIEADRVIRIKGCPPTHKRIIWDMMVKLFLLAPLVRPSLIIDGFILYPIKKLKGWLVNLNYKPLQRNCREQ